MTLTLLKEAEEEALGRVLPTTQPEDVTQPNPKELVRVTFVVEQPPRQPSRKARRPPTLQSFNGYKMMK